MKIKHTLTVFLVLCITVFCIGCSTGQTARSLKDNLLDGWNNWMQSYSRRALTKEHELIGIKTKGADAYTGTYTAEYDQFNGKEFLFGGTALTRKYGNRLQVSYTLSITKGTASLVFISGSDESIIADSIGEDTKLYTISAGDHYFYLQGENFSGSLVLSVEDVNT
ncbi:MAG: hypothetical protein J6I50_04360 [Clostridia bacterium]|nr:hypothetical protein [Clostridia bacterium]